MNVMDCVCCAVLKSQNEDKGETSFLQEVCLLVNGQYDGVIENVAPSVIAKRHHSIQSRIQGSKFQRPERQAAHAKQFADLLRGCVD